MCISESLLSIDILCGAVYCTEGVCGVYSSFYSFIPYSLLDSYLIHTVFVLYYSSIFHILYHSYSDRPEQNAGCPPRYRQRQGTSGSSIVPRILAQIAHVCMGGLGGLGWTLPSLDVPYFYPYPLSTLPPLPPLPPPFFHPTPHHNNIREHTTIIYHHTTKLPINCPH